MSVRLPAWNQHNGFGPTFVAAYVGYAEDDLMGRGFQLLNVTWVAEFRSATSADERIGLSVQESAVRLLRPRSKGLTCFRSSRTSAASEITIVPLRDRPSHRCGARSQ